MLRTMWSRLSSILRKPIFGTFVVPTNATVDPALFPEDEYPVYCTKCSYDLRMLPDGKCPECGTDFTRGQLLVHTYLLDRRRAMWRNSKAGKWGTRLMLVGGGIFLVSLLGQLCFKAISPRALADVIANDTLTKDSDSLFLLAYMIIGLLLVGILFFIAAGVISICYYPRGTWKRRRAIIDAIKQVPGQGAQETR